MIGQLIRICDKFTELNVLFDKLGRPGIRIDPPDLDCLTFEEFEHIPPCETLFWALRNLADQASEILVAPKGSRWSKYEERRETLKRLEDLANSSQREAWRKLASWRD